MSRMSCFTSFSVSRVHFIHFPSPRQDQPELFLAEIYLTSLFPICPVMDTHYLPKRKTVLQYPQLLISIYFMGVTCYEEDRSLKQMTQSQDSVLWHKLSWVVFYIVHEKRVIEYVKKNEKLFSYSHNHITVLLHLLQKWYGRRTLQFLNSNV